jgi:hypothetical protein
MKETVSDKYFYEKLIIPENKVDDGYYSEELGFVDFECIEECRGIQAELKKIGIDATLREAEYFWHSYSTDVYFSNFNIWSGEPLNEEEIEYAKKYFL